MLVGDNSFVYSFACSKYEETKNYIEGHFYRTKIVCIDI